MNPAILSAIMSVIGSGKQDTGMDNVGHTGLLNSMGTILGGGPTTQQPSASSQKSGAGGIGSILKTVLGQLGNKGSIQSNPYGLNANSPYVQNALQTYKFGA